MTESELRKKLLRIRQTEGLSLRQVETATGLSNAFICQFEKGSGIGHDNALKIEEFLSRFREPREWQILYQKCEHGSFGGMISSHTCKEWYVTGPPTDGKSVTVREVMQS